MEPPTPTRIMGLDVGDNRIGIAISDPLGYTAQPLLTLQRTNLRADLQSIARLIRKYGVTEVVIGNPLYMSGRLSPQAAKARALAEALHQHLSAREEGQNYPIPPIHLWDERLSTTQARRHLSDLGHSGGPTGRIERRNIIDQVAAVLILQAFIDSRDVPPR